MIPSQPIRETISRPISQNPTYIPPKIVSNIQPQIQPIRTTFNYIEPTRTTIPYQ